MSHGRERDAAGAADQPRPLLHARQPEPAGLGLGLWLVKSIIDRHGGRVAFERTATGRTRFSLTLPTEEAA